MAFDLVIQEAPAREMYPKSFRTSRQYLELSLPDCIERITAYLDVDDAVKPFGYAFEIDYGPDLVAGEGPLAELWSQHHYDPEAQIWSTSHQEIRMFGVYTMTNKLTYIGGGSWINDLTTDDAC